MATASVTYTLSNGTNADADEVMTNLNDILSFLNDDVIHKDASVAFTGIPSGPSSDPSTANQFTRKAYVDRFLRPKGGASQTPFAGATYNPENGLEIRLGRVEQTPNGSGQIAVNFATAFTTTLAGIHLQPFDANAAYITSVDSYSLSGFTMTLRSHDGTLITSGGRRIFYVAYGV